MIPYGRQAIYQDDINSVIDVLNSDFLTQGPLLPKFETAISKYCGAKYSVGMNSATSALHIACLSLDIGPGDIVWTSPITFAASANCALYCGASIDFIDIDPKTLNISIHALKEKLLYAKSINRIPKAIIPVHFSGQSCDMKEIKNLSDYYGFKIIEDASHAIGGEYLGQKIGNCIYSDITVFSFHPVKIITTGEGGIATTNNNILAERMMLLRSHGINKNKSKFTKQKYGPWHYEQTELGFNYRLTEIQSALGLSQLKKIDKFIAKRNNLANKYNELLNNSLVVKPYVEANNLSSFHLYVIQIKDINYDENIKIHLEMQKRGIGVNLHYIPVYLHPYYQISLGFKSGYCKNAENYYQRAMTIPLHPTLTLDMQKFIINNLIEILNI